MATVTSRDGTTIAYETRGQGAPLILVDGALCYRSFGPMGGLSERLAPHFTVYLYDRRGRGESGDTLPYALEREIEDLDALIQQAGGSAYVYGISSGAALALQAAAHSLNITRLALYEPPYQPGMTEQWTQYQNQLATLLAAGERSEAVVAFMSYVGTPEDAIAGMRHAPVWPMFEAVAPTLAYDAAALGDGTAPVKKAATVAIPTLVMAGGASLPFMHENAQALEAAMPNAERRLLEGQTHQVDDAVLAPVLIEFFQGQAG